MKNKNKLYIFLYLILFLVVVIMLAGSAYSYYLNNKKANPEVEYQKINALIEYDNGEVIDVKKMSPGFEKEYNFKVINNNLDSLLEYKLSMEVITPLLDSVDENFVYTLECETDSKDKSNVLINKEDIVVPTINKDIGGGVITPNTIHNYKLTIKVKKNGQDKKYLLDKVFVAKIKLLNDGE